MDPVSQAAVGAIAASAAAAISDRHHPDIKLAAAVGALAGMAPDLDILIRSSSDPLLTLEFHRQFTHSLFFIPLGALLGALVFYCISRWRGEIRFSTLYLWCLAGYGSHGLLDACTSYGTQLYWPLSDYRVAWNVISVVDPLFTLPLVLLLAVAAIRNSRMLICCGLAWASLYLSAGWIQHQRAQAIGQTLAQARNHTPSQILARPSFGNIAVWKLIYEQGGFYYTDATKPGWRKPTVWQGDRIKKLDLNTQFAWLNPDSQQARDIERFRHFSSGYLSAAPDRPDRIVDIRYSLLPQDATGIWGLELDSEASSKDHADYFVERKQSREALPRLLAMIFQDYEAATELAHPPKL